MQVVFMTARNRRWIAWKLSLELLDSPAKRSIPRPPMTGRVVEIDRERKRERALVCVPAFLRNALKLAATNR